MSNDQCLYSSHGKYSRHFRGDLMQVTEVVEGLGGRRTKHKNSSSKSLEEQRRNYVSRVIAHCHSQNLAAK